MSASDDLLAPLLARLRQARESLGLEMSALDAATRFAEAIDSMGFVEFLSLIAEDFGVPVEAIEQATGRRYGTVAELATALHDAGLRPGTPISSPRSDLPQPLSAIGPQVWLAATAVGLPAREQAASDLNARLGRPSGWLEERAGIVTRRVWEGEDVLDAAARTARACLLRAGFSGDPPGAILVTSEAPPLPTGLAAALHHRLGLSSDVVALELGGACTGFLAAMWTARRLLTDTSVVLVLAVEAPSRWLAVEPGAAGEAAALFGDAAAACVLTTRPTANALLLRDVFVATDGSGHALLQVRRELGRGVALHLDGVPLAQSALRVMADAVRQMSARHGLTPQQLAAVVIHGGNGRFPELLARRLGLPVERVWSQTPRTGNLGSASLPVAWSAQVEPIRGPVIWTAAGAGLQWGAALFDSG